MSESVPTQRLSQYSLPIKNRGTEPHGMQVHDAALVLVPAFQRTVRMYRETHPALKNLRLLVRRESPETLPELLAEVKRGSLTVTYLHSETSIYGVPGNVWFRWHHDLGHVITGLETKYRDELALAELQLWHIAEAINGRGLSYQQRAFVLACYMADTAAQADHYQEFGGFPDDQAAHVHQCLKDWGWFPENA